MTPFPSQRDPRIDFCRGLCLLLIYSGHIHPNVFKAFTPIGIGLADTAEAFIFLSGLACGMAYGKALQEGFLFCQLKALRRCWEIYRAHILTLFINFAFFSFFFGAPNSEATQFLENPAWGLPHIFILSLFPYVYSILPLYILFLLPLPAFLWLSRKVGRWQMIAFVYSIYAAVQIFPETLRLPQTWANLYFNPLAWQFLFYAGVALGRGPGKCGEWLPRNGVSVLLVVAAVMLVFLSSLFNANHHDFLILTGKANLEPLRLIYFFLLAYACWVFIPFSGRLYQNRLAKMVVRCGQNSLTVFCFGVFLTNLANEVLRSFGHSAWCQLAANIAGWLALLLLGSVLHLATQILSTGRTTETAPRAGPHNRKEIAPFELSS